ncbi:hypothetical protein TNCV_4007161 [Trichonephila clavipes]|nr:hypothetical protein TNCV_4007161 [Trichonephila clavipes]
MGKGAAHNRTLQVQMSHERISFHFPTQGLFKDFNNYVSYDDELPTCATEIEDIVDLSQPMNSDSGAKIDNETLIKTVTFSNVLYSLETVKRYFM